VASASVVNASVVVPSYRRPEDLTRCLNGLARQVLAPAEAIVVRRADDQLTQAAVSACQHAGVVDVVVGQPGVLAAMNAGVAAARSEIIAFVDDDAVPRPEWLARLVQHFDDPKVGGVGGRDVICAGAPEVLTEDVGRITSWGKLIGNHHRGTGKPRDVMVLKAAGMAFRSNALVLPDGLRGGGAQAHFEVGMSLSARRRGWRLIYDPGALVDHYVAPRFDADRRHRPARSAVQNAAYNLVTCLLQEAPELFWRRAAYGLLIGDRRMPGLLRAAAGLVRNEPDVVGDLYPSLAGQVRALLAAHRHARRSRGDSHSRSLRCTARPRVALLAHDVHGEGGMERACLELILHASHEVDFVVISSRLDPSVRRHVTWRRVPIPRRPFALKFTIYYLLAGLRLALEPVDLVHTVGAIVPKKVDVASVHFCHAAFHANAAGRNGSASPLRRLNARVVSALSLAAERWSYRPSRVKRLAAVSTGAAREVQRFYPGIQTYVTVNGIDHDRFRPDAETSQQMRALAGVGRETCVALFVGGDWDRKGLALAIEGTSRARSRGVPVALWVVGPGDRARFQALADRLKATDHVRFFGHRADTERFYQAADIFVLPTSYETFSIAAFEAAASALPLVTTAVHGAADLVGRDAAGICIDRTVAALVDALVRLGTDATLRASLGAAARERSRAFTWTRSVQEVLAVYRSIVAPASPSASDPCHN